MVKRQEPGKYTSQIKYYQYGEEPSCEGDILSVEDYLGCVERRVFIDYDGEGHPMKDGMIDRTIDIIPSLREACIPCDATHIMWYNR